MFLSAIMSVILLFPAKINEPFIIILFLSEFGKNARQIHRNCFQLTANAAGSEKSAGQISPRIACFAIAEMRIRLKQID